MSKIESLARAHASPSEIHPGGKFQRHFTCVFHFRHFPRLPFSVVLSVLNGLIPMGTMDPFLLEDNPFKTAKKLVNYV